MKLPRFAVVFLLVLSAVTPHLLLLVFYAWGTITDRFLENGQIATNDLPALPLLLMVLLAVCAVVHIAAILAARRRAESIVRAFRIVSPALFIFSALGYMISLPELFTIYYAK